MSHLAIIYMNLGKYADAATQEVQVVDAWKKIFGEEHSKTVEAVALLAEIRSQGNINTSGIDSRKKGEFYLI